MKKRKLPSDATLRRRVERNWKKANDPYFGNRRPGGEMGRNRSKAGINKSACRGRTKEGY